MPSKKITVILGSPHKNGVTAKLLNTFLNSIPDEKIISFFDAYEMDVKPCINCEFCKNNLGCRYDDMSTLYRSLARCDYIIVAFPIYNASLPSPLKSILDRLQPFYFQKGEIKLAPKNTLVITTQGSKSKDYESTINSQLEPNLSLLNSKNIYYFALKNTDNLIFDIDKFYLKSENKIDEIIYHFIN